MPLHDCLVLNLNKGLDEGLDNGLNNGLNNGLIKISEKCPKKGSEKSVYFFRSLFSLKTNKLHMKKGADLKLYNNRPKLRCETTRQVDCLLFTYQIFCNTPR